MYVRAEYKNRLASGGRVISGGGDTPILKEPPVVDDAGEYIPTRDEAVAAMNAEPEEVPVAQEQIEAALDRARNGVRSEIPPVRERYRPEPRGITYSAPVSRSDVPSGSSYRGSGRVTLSVAQKEAAKMAGVSESEYARQVLRLQEAKAAGDYLESR